MTSYPEPWVFALLVLGAMRITRLVGWDTLTAGLRERATGWTDDGHRLDVTHPSRARGQAIRAFVSCPWCLGFWISVLVWLAWLEWPRATLVAMTPFAINAVVGVIVKKLDE